MEIKTTFGPVTVLSVTGDIDAATFPQLVSAVNEVLDKGNVKLVLDLGQVNYISSGGLVALQTISGRAGDLNGKVALCSVRDRVAKVLNISGFDKFLAVFPDVAAARASLEEK